MRYERALPVQAEMEFRAVGDEWQFRGYAALFDIESDPRLGFIETVAPSAFNRSLGAKTHSFVVDHTDALLLSTERTDRLHLSADSKGLLTESMIPDTSYARDLAALHEAGETSGMSFTFKPTRGGTVPGHHTSGLQSRRLIDVNLGHVTILTSAHEPAYPATATAFQFRAVSDALACDPAALEAMFDKILTGRQLDPADVALLGAVGAYFNPTEAVEEAAEPDEGTPDMTTMTEERALLEKWTALLTEKGVITPQ